MKTNKLLYELLENIDAAEANRMEKEFNHFSSNVPFHDKNAIKRQECLTMNKIHKALQKEPQSKSQMGQKSYSHGHFGRKRLVLLVAAAIMLFGMVSFARENNWDVEMAEMLGLSGVMKSLDGGYVTIGESETQEDITVTAVQSIGDQNFQWIQFDTNIPWNVGETGYYMFDEFQFDFTAASGGLIDGGSEFYSYNNNGMVSFMLYAMGVEKINRADVDITLGMLYQYENMESDGILISDKSWHLAWDNYYAPNTITKHPFSMVDGLLLHKIEISPISIHAEAIGAYSKDARELTVEQITMKDGTTISCLDMSFENSNNINFDHFVVYENLNSIDLEEITSVTINGQQINLR